MTQVKICGIREKAHAVGASYAGAGFIGLVFAPSSRQVAPAQAQEIAAAIKEHHRETAVVGVFVNMPGPAVNRVAQVCGLDWVQLSGDETWAYCQQIHLPVIKSVRVRPGESAEELAEYLANGEEILASQRHLFLLDAHVEGSYGGTGTGFDWEIAAAVARKFPVVIAGGLTPENVSRLVRTVYPWGVDVSSGVEEGGVKSLARVKAFIDAVRKANG
jgi:phosphoribosylanthranilate isomerase